MRTCALLLKERYHGPEDGMHATGPGPRRGASFGQGPRHPRPRPSHSPRDVAGQGGWAVRCRGREVEDKDYGGPMHSVGGDRDAEIAMAKRTYCPHCDIPLRPTWRAFALHGLPLGVFPALLCPSCGRVAHPLTTSLAIERTAKRLGLFGKPFSRWPKWARDAAAEARKEALRRTAGPRPRPRAGPPTRRRPPTPRAG